MRKAIELTAAGVLVVTLCAFSAGCRNSRNRAASVVGSTSIQPFAEMLAEEFNKRNPKENVEIQGGGSQAGILAINEGNAAIGMCSRELSKEEEKTLTAIPIAQDGLAIVVHPSNSVTNLTRDQIRKIFVGQITNWKLLGGNDVPIRMITREEGSGTREAFAKLVMGKEWIANTALVQESNGAVRELVRNDPGAVGYMSLGLVSIDLRAVAIDGVPPTVQNVVDHKYSLVRRFLFVVRQDGPKNQAAQKFIDYVLSPEGQAMLEKEGLVKVK